MPTITRSARADRAVVVHEQLAAFALDALDVRARHLDLGRASLRLELLEERLFHLGGELELAGRHHLRRVGEDRFVLGKILDGVPLLRRLVDHEAQTRPLGLDRGGDPGDAGADDRQIEPLRIVLAAALFEKSGSARIASTARAPESAENLSSGTPVRSPTMRTPGTASARRRARTRAAARRCRPASRCAASECNDASMGPLARDGARGIIITLRRQLWIGFGSCSFSRPCSS